MYSVFAKRKGDFIARLFYNSCLGLVLRHIYTEQLKDNPFNQFRLKQMKFLGVMRVNVILRFCVLQANGLCKHAIL